MDVEKYFRACEALTEILKHWSSEFRYNVFELFYASVAFQFTDFLPSFICTLKSYSEAGMGLLVGAALLHFHVPRVDSYFRHYKTLCDSTLCWNHIWICYNSSIWCATKIFQGEHGEGERQSQDGFLQQCSKWMGWVPHGDDWDGCVGIVGSVHGHRRTEYHCLR